MILFLKILLGLLLPFLTGYHIVAWLFPKEPLAKTFHAALAYGLGMGVLTQMMFLSGILKIPFHLSTLAPPLLLIILIGRLVHKKQTAGQNKKITEALSSLNKVSADERFQRSTPKEPTKGDLLYYGSFLFLTFYTLFVFWRALHLPIFEWDAFAFISYKAKIFFYTRELPSLLQLPHSSYPLHVPLMETWVALTIGSWDDQMIKIIFPLAFLSYLVIHYHVLAILLGHRSWAMFGTALLVTSHQFVFYGSVAYREIFMVLYNVSTILLLLLWQQKRREPGYLYLAGLFAGLATFTKLEGMAYLFIYLVICWLITGNQKVLHKDRWIDRARFVTTSLLFFLPFFLFKMLTQTPSSEKTHLSCPGDIFGQLFLILGSFSHYLFFSGNWNMLWFLLILSLPKFFLTKQRPETVLVGLAIGLFFVLYLGIGVSTGSGQYLVGTIAIDAVPRIILHFFPLCPLFLMLLNAPCGYSEN